MNRTVITLLSVFLGGGVVAILLAASAHAACSLSGPDGNGVRTNTCTGETTGRQQARGSNTEEKLILQSGASISNIGGQGILGRGDAAATRVTIETAGDITAETGIQFDMGRPGDTSDGLSTLRITGGTISATGTGVSFNSRALGGFTFDMTGGFIGTSTTRVGGSGLSAGIRGTASSNAIDIDSNGAIYATERGMSLTHAGTGAIDVDLKSDSIIDTTGSGNRGAGVYISRNGPGIIDVDNAGIIRSAGHDGIFILNESDGAITIQHRSGGRIEAANTGIYIRHGNANAGGNGAITVTSSGDITTTGATGIFLDLNRGVTTATDQVRIDLTGGTIKAASTGVQVNSRTIGGLDFDLANGASIGTISEVVGETGVNLFLSNTANTNTLDVDSDGTIHARWRGMSLTHNGTGDIDVDLTKNSRIMTQKSLITVGDRTLTRGAGVHAFHSGSGDISIDHQGTIDSGTGTGIYAQHNGTGNLEVINSGMITSGFQGIEARRLGAGLLNITHRGGSITANRGPGIFARHDGTRTSNKYDVNLIIEGDVTTTDPNQAAVRADVRGPASNAGIRIDHNAGTITGNWGISATSARFSGSTWGGQTPASFTRPTDYPSSGQSVVLIQVGGDPNNPTRILARPLSGSGNEFTAAQTEHQAGWVSRDLAGVYLMPSAITVGGGDYVRIGQDIAAGDKGQASITPEIRTQFRAVHSAAQAYQSDPNAISLGNLLDPRLLVNGFSGDPASTMDIDNYLNMESNLAKFREFTLSEAEKRVLKAIYGDGSLETALDALPSSYTDGYKNMVRWYAGAYNDADFRVEIKNGSLIESTTGDGIRAVRRFPSDRNGASTVIIESGATVRVDRYGVRMRGAGYDPDRNIRKHTVDIRAGAVLESTGSGGAAIALAGGGHVKIGSSVILASASGNPIKIDNPDPGRNLIVEITSQEGEAFHTIQRRALLNGVKNAGQTTFIIDGVEVPTTSILGITTSGAAMKDICSKNPEDRIVSGAYDVCAIDSDVDFIHSPFAPRSHIYETMPSVLLGMNDVFMFGAMHGVRGNQAGPWASIIAEQADKDPKDSTVNASYDIDRTGLILGRDVETNDSGTLGLFLHYQEGAARVRDGGKIRASARGLGIRRHWERDPYFFDINASATSFRNDLISSLRGKLASDVSGTGYAVGMEAGYRAAIPEASLTSVMGIAHSVVEIEKFTDMLGVEIPSIKGEETTLHVRTMLEKPIGASVLFAGVNLQAPLDSEVRTKVGNTRLSAKSRAAAGAQGGIVFGGGESGPKAALSLGYTKEGGGNAIEAGLSFSL